MTNARRILILLVVLALPMWAAAGASGTPGDKPPRCDDPPCKDEPQPPRDTGSVLLTVEPNLLWAQEASDVVIYAITVDNGSDTDVDVISSLGDGLDEPVPAGTSTTVYQEHPLAGDYAGVPLGTNPGTLTNTVSALADGEPVAEASADVQLYNETPPCDFSKEIPGLCIWTPDAPGDWIVSVEPAGPRTTNVQITLRDHVPGNWCPTGIRTKWRPGDGPVETTFSIRDWEKVSLGDPVCTIGGAAGDFFGVGTPDSFFLAISGNVTVRPAPAGS